MIPVHFLDTVTGRTLCGREPTFRTRYIDNILEIHSEEITCKSCLKSIQKRCPPDAETIEEREHDSYLSRLGIR